MMSVAMSLSYCDSNEIQMKSPVRLNAWELICRPDGDVMLLGNGGDEAFLLF